MSKARKRSARKQKPTSRTRNLLSQTVHPDAAGIDIGARELHAAVPADRSEHPVRAFGTMTPQLEVLADWLIDCGIKTVAMESTGSYWIPVFMVLEERGLDVWLVNARDVRNVPGRKSDQCDAAWLLRLHQSGLMSKSFQPEALVREIRCVTRTRAGLVQAASREIQLMQKALDEMNIRLHHVLRDITGVSGCRIIEAILEGERDPVTLEQLRDGRCRKPAKEVHAALTGTWREGPLFALQMAYKRWQSASSDIESCDHQLGQLTAELTGEGSAPLTTCAAYDPVAESTRIYGVDLSSLEGIGPGFLRTLLSEVGGRQSLLEAFPSAGHFSSWLGLCPNPKVTGGRVISSQTRKVSNPLSQAFRMAAFGAEHGKTAMGEYCRRMKARLGKSQGLVATAHKIARLVYTLIRQQVAYDPEKAFRPSEARRKRRIDYLRKSAKTMGYCLVKQPEASSC